MFPRDPGFAHRVRSFHPNVQLVHRIPPVVQTPAQKPVELNRDLSSPELTYSTKTVSEVPLPHLPIGEPEQMPSKAPGWPYNAPRADQGTYFPRPPLRKPTARRGGPEMA